MKYKTDLELISVNLSVASISEMLVTDMDRRPVRLDRPSRFLVASVLPIEDDSEAHRANMMRIELMRLVGLTWIRVNIRCDVRDPNSEQAAIS